MKNTTTKSDVDRIQKFRSKLIKTKKHFDHFTITRKKVGFPTQNGSRLRYNLNFENLLQ